MSDQMRKAFESSIEDPEDLKDVTWDGHVYVATPRSNSLTGAFRLMADWRLWQKAWQAARQAPASGEVEPVMELDISEDRCFSPNLIDETLSLPAGHYKLYTHPPAKVPEGITGEMLNKVWKAGFDAENIDDREYCQELIILRNAVEDATPTPATTPETEWVKCSDRLPTEDDADLNGKVWCWAAWKGEAIMFGVNEIEFFCSLPEPEKSVSHWKPTGLKRPAPPQEQ